MILVDNDKDFLPFLVWPIEVTKVGILEYAATRVGQPLPRTSVELMPPGDYAAYFGMINPSYGLQKILS